MVAAHRGIEQCGARWARERVRLVGGLRRRAGALLSVVDGGLRFADSRGDVSGTPVVTSAGTSTEEVAGGAAVLVDPLSVDSIAEGIRDALARRGELAQLGVERAKGASWEATAGLVARAYRDAAQMGARR